jgi:hypothetical protein
MVSPRPSPLHDDTQHKFHRHIPSGPNAHLLLVSHCAAPTKTNKSMRGHANIIRAAAVRPPNPELEGFMLNLAVCNTVVPAISEDGHFVYQVGASLRLRGLGLLKRLGDRR